MKYYIYHWYRGSTQPVLEAFEEEVDGDKLWFVEVEDIHAFVEKHGPIQLKPPSEATKHRKAFPFWSIYVTDHTGSFGQK